MAEGSDANIRPGPSKAPDRGQFLSRRQVCVYIQNEAAHLIEPGAHPMLVPPHSDNTNERRQGWDFSDH